MKLAPKGVGAEPKKLALLVVLLLGAGGTYYWMSRPDVPAGANPAPASSGARRRLRRAATSSTSPASAPRATTSSYGPRTATRGGRTSSSGDDFRPTLKLPDGMDVSRIDPTLKLDLMAKVRNVSVEGGSRSLFEFYTPPPPPPPPVPKPQPIVPKPLTAAKQMAAEGEGAPRPSTAADPTEVLRLFRSLALHRAASFLPGVAKTSFRREKTRPSGTATRSSGSG